MAVILKHWLSERLNRNVDWENTQFTQIMKDGSIISELLLKYGILNEQQQFLVKKTTSPEVIKINWKNLSIWLRQMDIHIDEEMELILEGNETVILRVFYQLFLYLERRDRIDFIKREKKKTSALVKKFTPKFSQINEYEIQKIDANFLTKPLADNKDITEWTKRKSKETKELYDFIRSKLLTRKDAGDQVVARKKENVFLSKREKEEMDSFEKNNPSRNVPYKKLIEMAETPVQGEHECPDKWVEQYLRSLRSKVKNKKFEDTFRNNLEREISSSIFNEFVDDDEHNPDFELAKSVMKLSRFEKQMCTQLMELKQQGRQLVQSRINAEAEFDTQRACNFSEYLEDMQKKNFDSLEEINHELLRQNELHNRLYAEKLRRIKQHHYNICYDTASDLVDVAVKCAYTKILMFPSEVPEMLIHDWKLLFFKQRSIFDLIEHVEDTVYPSACESATEIEDILHNEIERQDCMNSNDFWEYHNRMGPWDLETLLSNYTPDTEESLIEHLGDLVFGYIVHKILAAKYPPPPEKKPAGLPNFKSKAVVIGLDNRSVLGPVQALLAKRRIVVVRLETAINYCLFHFKKEMVDFADLVYTEDEFAENENNVELLEYLKEEREKCESSQSIYEDLDIYPFDKQTQTPLHFVPEEVELSNAGELGKYIYETLSVGNPLTDFLIASSIIEYLKSQVDIDGFVLINYPETYNQAVILEEMFTGRRPHARIPQNAQMSCVPSYSDKECFEDNFVLNDEEEQNAYLLLSKSKIVPKPVDEPEDPYTTYFTAFIKLKPSDDILAEPFIYELKPDNADLIEIYYTEEGVNYSLYYTIFDKEFLSFLCFYIIGDFSTPFQDYNTLFGENVLSMLDFPVNDDKKKKTMAIKPEIKSKSKDKIKKRQSIVEVLETVGEDMPQTFENENSEYLLEEISVEEDEITRPGEEGWIYCELPIDENFLINLGGVWEYTEKTYIDCMQKYFFARRQQINSLIPYSRFVKDRIYQILAKPIIQQELVEDFQAEYNAFDIDWLVNFEAKVEWHCRIKELQTRLYDMVDARKKEAEDEKNKILDDHWTMYELNILANVYIACMQTELNRSIITFQILQDYYHTMIKSHPTVDRLPFKELQFLFVDEVDKQKKSEDKLRDKLIKYLLNNEIFNESNNPYYAVLETNVKLALKTAIDISNAVRAVINKECQEIIKTPGAVAKLKKADEPLRIHLSSENIAKANQKKCVDEWLVAVNGEYNRLNIALQMLLNQACRDFKLFHNHMMGTFEEIQGEIDDLYKRSTRSVDRVCQYFRLLVEQSKKIDETVFLDEDFFSTDAALIRLTAETPVLPVKPIKFSECDFRIYQLASLYQKFNSLSPNGYFSIPRMVYLLQDFLLYLKENCPTPHFPMVWSKMDPDIMPELVAEIFSDTEYIDWRDFIIYALNITYPTVQELKRLIEMLSYYDTKGKEVITRYEFMETHMWFECEDNAAPPLKLKSHLTKALLFEVFKTNDDEINYMDFFYSFCKSDDPIEGFVTAISISIDNYICFKPEVCKATIDQWVDAKLTRDRLRVEARKCVLDLAEYILKKVFQTCEGTTVTEIVPQKKVVSNPEIKDKKQQKKKRKTSKEKENFLKDKDATSSKRKLEKQSSPIVTKIGSDTHFESEYTMAEQLDFVEEEEKSIVATVYSVNPEIILNVINRTLPWLYQVPVNMLEPSYSLRINMLLDELSKQHEFGEIYICNLISDECFRKIISKVNKFRQVNFALAVHNVIFDELNML